MLDQKGMFFITLDSVKAFIKKSENTVLTLLELAIYCQKKLCKKFFIVKKPWFT